MNNPNGFPSPAGPDMGVRPPQEGPRPFEVSGVEPIDFGKIKQAAKDRISEKHPVVGAVIDALDQPLDPIYAGETNAPTVEVDPNLEHAGKISAMREALGNKVTNIKEIGAATKETVVGTAKELFQEVAKPVMKFAGVEVVVGAGKGVGVLNESNYTGKTRISATGTAKLVGTTIATRGKNLPKVAKDAQKGVEEHVAKRAKNGEYAPVIEDSARKTEVIVGDTGNKYRQTRENQKVAKVGTTNATAAHAASIKSDPNSEFALAA